MSQPILGILTLYLNEQKQLEERSIYQKMISAGRKMGLDVYVFTPQDVDEQHKRIYAMYYHPETRRWTRKWSRFPHMIFDRCRIQNSYRFKQLRQFRSKYNHLLFLNRPLRNKWVIYQILSGLPSFKKHLPSTYLYRSIQDLQSMLRTHPFIYLKPVNGTGGRGILRIERLQNSPSSVFVQGRDRERRIIQPQKLSMKRLATKLAAWQAKDRYLIQQGIALELPNGRVHDYRMLVQKNGNGKWETTGCVGRVGARKSITSNLHGGGEAVRMDNLLRQWFDNEQRIVEMKEDAERVSLEVTQFLEGKYGALCELALDLAVDRKGHVWLLEVNPKPAREVFNRIGDRETYRNAITRPLEYAVWLHNQKGKHQGEAAISIVDSDCLE